MTWSVTVKMLPVEVDIVQMLSWPFKALKVCGLNYRVNVPPKKKLEIVGRRFIQVAALEAQTDTKPDGWKEKAARFLGKWFVKFFFVNAILGWLYRAYKLHANDSALKDFTTLVYFLGSFAETSGLLLKLFTMWRFEARIIRILEEFGQIDISRIQPDDNKYNDKIRSCLKAFQGHKILKMLVHVATRALIIVGPVVGYISTGKWYSCDFWNKLILFESSNKVLYNFAFIWYNWFFITFGCIAFAFDVILYGLVLVVAVRFTVLSHDLAFAIDAGWNLKPFVERHCEILRLVREINEIFAGAFVWTFYSSSVVICCAMFVATNSSEIATALTSGGLTLLILSQIVFLCHVGELMKEFSTLIVEAIEASEWCELNANSKFIIEMMHLQAMKPCTLNAWKFTKLDFEKIRMIFGVIFLYWSTFTTLKKLG
jgi:7tm Odorant receptor